LGKATPPLGFPAQRPLGAFIRVIYCGVLPNGAQRQKTERVRQAVTAK